MSAVLEMQYPGIAMNAVLLTFSTAASLFVALKTRMITITDRFTDTVRMSLSPERKPYGQQSCHWVCKQQYSLNDRHLCRCEP